MEWISVYENPTNEGDYVTQNQYKQINLSNWNGKKWDLVRVLKGSCMCYGDEKVIFWKAKNGMD